MNQALIILLSVLVISGIMFSSSFASEITPTLEAVHILQNAVGLIDKPQSENSMVNLSDASALLRQSAKEYSFEIHADEGGDIPAGLDKSVNGAYQAGEIISIAARAMPGYRFVEWKSSGGGSFADAKNSQTQFTMPAEDVIITACFTPLIAK